MSLVALPQTWTLGVILNVTDTRMDIGTLPVIGMFSNGDEIEPVVALHNGQIARSSRLEWEVLFLAAPEESPQKAARLAIAARGGESGIELAFDVDDISVS